MNKNKIIITSVVSLFVALALLGGYKLLDTVCYPLVKAEAEYYLCKKYNAGPEEFELVDYKRAKIYWDDPYIFFLTPKWTDFSFEFKYNNRNFFVNRENGEFYDDYQLEDIEKWCTEWLQENVDERIIGLQITNENIANYQKNARKSDYYVITEEDAKEFLNNYSINFPDNFAHKIYYYESNILNETEMWDVNEEIENKAHQTLNLDEKIFAYYLDKNKYSINKITEKPNDHQWISIIAVDKTN